MILPITGNLAVIYFPPNATLLEVEHLLESILQVVRKNNVLVGMQGYLNLRDLRYDSQILRIMWRNIPL